MIDGSRIQSQLFDNFTVQCFCMKIKGDVENYIYFWKKNEVRRKRRKIILSEIGWYKSKIKLVNIRAYAPVNVEENPSFQILKRSLEIVAQEHDGTLAEFVIDSYGRKTACDLAVKTPKFQRGVGIKIDRNTGEVTFLYDQYGDYGKIARKIVGEITQNYVAMALIKAMKSLGYEVKEETSKQRETIMLIGRV